VAAQFGVTGLAVMGQNLARNVARHGVPVAVHNRTTSRTTALIEQHGDEGEFIPAETLKDFVAAMDRPRRAMIMVQAGRGTDAVLDELVPLLDPGDVVVDGGNAHFIDTRRRAEAINATGVQFVGSGVSGGEEGALLGPSIMPGGTTQAYDVLAPVLETIAAQVDGTPCCTLVGPDGAGHFVKMVHNGIEYADMQLIAEAYDLLRSVGGLEPAELAAVFADWNSGDLESFLIETTATVLGHVDARTGRPFVDVVVDQAEQKGTGRWTVQSALDLGVPVTAIGEATFARVVSSLAGERRTAQDRLAGPRPARQTNDRLVDDVRQALYASKVVAYAQGFAQIAAGSEEYGWGVDPGAMATIWRGGCIIRARFLDRIKQSFDDHTDLSNLLFADYFADAVGQAQDAWRRVVATSAESGVPAPAFSASLAYYDQLRRDRSSAALIQGLRDFFGAHTYRRVDDDGAFHTLWSDDRSEVRP
jgi:6-phosphogluconate dehydrogenase